MECLVGLQARQGELLPRDNVDIDLQPRPRQMQGEVVGTQSQEKGMNDLCGPLGVI